jgi:hypothetical protein
MNYIINIRDPTEEKLNEMVDYCNDNNMSLVKFENIDVSDFSFDTDQLAIFHFGISEDAAVFKLKFG